MLTHNCMIWIERGEKVLYFYIFISRSSEFLTCNGLYKFISSNFEKKSKNWSFLSCNSEKRIERCKIEIWNEIEKKSDMWDKKSR